MEAPYAGLANQSELDRLAARVAKLEQAVNFLAGLVRASHPDTWAAVAALLKKP